MYLEQRADSGDDELGAIDQPLDRLHVSATRPVLLLKTDDDFNMGEGDAAHASQLPEHASPHVEPVKGASAATIPITPPAEPTLHSSGLMRPPPKPKSLLGPFLQFTTTYNDRQVWRGSALTLHRHEGHADCPRPKFTIDHDLVSPALEEPVEVLYENIFGMTALRYDIAVKVPDGAGDEVIGWTLEWEEEKRTGNFHVARWGQRWRGGANSCNGFDETVPDETIKNFGFEGVWKHLTSVHQETPLHVLIYGGDQVYIDLIFHDIPWLKGWIELPFEKKWNYEVTEEAAVQLAEYYFNSYCLTWSRGEVYKALSSIPSLMTWDDHDIFDGAGSYPPEQHDSPVMLALFRAAQKFRLLFQHHTTPELATTKHHFFGSTPCTANFIAQCGPSMAILGTDGRTERDATRVMAKESWDMIFDRLNNVAPTTQHLLVIFAVPFSFIRVKIAEKIFEFLKNRAPWVRQLPGIKGSNSIFGLPEFYDDLLDEWCHESHIAERDAALKRFQALSEKTSIRVTFLSGDVHCCTTSRFRSDTLTRKSQQLTPARDHRLMFQFVSSAIVNQAPSPNVCIAYHYIANKWNPIAKTEEALVEMFERRPEGGKHVRHRKVMPNRNYLVFEAVGPGIDGSRADPNSDLNYVVRADEDAESGGKPSHKPGHHSQRHGHAVLDWARENYSFDKKRGYPSTLGPTSGKDGTGAQGKPLHNHKHGFFCHHRKSRHLNPSMKAQDATRKEDGAKISEQEKLQRVEQPETAPTGLRVRYWLESRVKEAAGRQFSSYEVVVPNLTVGDAQPVAPKTNGAVDASVVNAPPTARLSEVGSIEAHGQPSNMNGATVLHEFQSVEPKVGGEPTTTGAAPVAAAA